MAEDLKLGYDSTSLSFKVELGGLGNSKMANSNQEGFLDRTKRLDNDSFVVEIDNLSITNDKDITANSRFTLQRSLSRKGSQRGEKKSSSITTSRGIERDTLATVTSTESSLKVTGGPVLVGVGAGAGTGTGGMPDKSIPVPVEMGMVTTTSPTAEGKYKRSGGRRSSIIDPRRMLFFFATLSSMGTIILIYFTLSIGRLNGDDISQNQ